MKSILAASFACVLCLASTQRLFAHAGDFDPWFGAAGVVILGSLYPASPFDHGNKVAVQPDGKIMIVGRAGGDASGIWRSAFAVIRLNPDGTLDQSFGPDGGGYFIFPWSQGPAEAHAIVFAPDGDIVVGGNVANLAGVVWLTPAGTFDITKGDNGLMTFAINNDTAHTTTLNAMTIENWGSNGYQLDFAGSFDGIGYPQMALGSYSPTEPIGDRNPFLAAVVPAGTNGNGVATALLDDGDAGVIVGGYVQNSAGQTQCVVARYSSDICYSNDGGNTWVCGWFPDDTSYGNSGGAFVDQIYSNEFGSAAPCYIDALASTGLGNYVIAGGREFFPGATRAMYFELDNSGGLLPYYNVFELSRWGDNSIREVLPEDNGKWAFAGFSGIDFSGVPDPVVARVDFIDGTLDGSFGYGGLSVLDFDPDTNAYGQTLGAALDAHGCIVQVGTYWNGGSDGNGNDFTQMFVARLQPDSSDTVDTIFMNGFDPPVPLCGP